MPTRKLRFAVDSPVEGTGFEPSVPRKTPKRRRDIGSPSVPSNDDHVIKMAYTCHRESTRYGNPLYQAAAARLVAVGTTE